MNRMDKKWGCPISLHTVVEFIETTVMQTYWTAFFINQVLS